MGQVHDSRIAGRFDDIPGARAVVIVHAQRISDSCGYSVPLYIFTAQLTRLVEWAEHSSLAELDEHRALKNAQSIDGLPAFS